jgi:cell division septation protein DedD
MATTTTTTFRTLTARFAGICGRCNGPITIGQTIRYGGKGRTYHLATACQGSAYLADADATDAPDATLAPTFPLRQDGEGGNAYGRRVVLYALQLEAPVFSELDNDGLEAGATVCNHLMAERGVTAGTVACLTALQRELRARLAGRRADTAQRLAGLQASADALQGPTQPDAPVAPPAAPQQPGGGSKVKAPKGPKPVAPPAATLPTPAPFGIPALALDADAF